MKYPDKPELPVQNDNTGVTLECHNCGFSVEEKTEWRSESEEISPHEDRSDKWCPECDEWLGVKISYHGPVPVTTYNGTELH